MMLRILSTLAILLLIVTTISGDDDKEIYKNSLLKFQIQKPDIKNMVKSLDNQFSVKWEKPNSKDDSGVLMLGVSVYEKTNNTAKAFCEHQEEFIKNNPDDYRNIKNFKKVQNRKWKDGDCWEMSLNFIDPNDNAIYWRMIYVKSNRNGNIYLIMIMSLGDTHITHKKALDASINSFKVFK